MARGDEDTRPAPDRDRRATVGAERGPASVADPALALGGALHYPHRARGLLGRAGGLDGPDLAQTRGADDLRSPPLVPGAARRLHAGEPRQSPVLPAGGPPLSSLRGTPACGP